MLIRGLSVALTVTRSVLNKIRHVLILLIVSVIVAAALFSFIEGKNFFDGLWWAVVTGWTIGYGDVFPVTIAGRIVAIIYIVWFGILWLIVAAHILAAVLIDKNAFTAEEQETVKATLLEIGQRLGVIDQKRTSLPSASEWAQNGHYTIDGDEGPNGDEQEHPAFGITGE